MYRKMPEYTEVYNEVFQLPDFCIEMTEEESAVLCGLIKERMPRKIVEVGTAEGGSACLILRCLEKLGLTNSMFYSIDLFEKLWNDDTKETGYLLKENSDKFINFNNFKLMLGKYVVDRIDEIGDEIDLVFLDTTHHIPGEILEFLVLFPHLSPNAVVVLHDTNLHNAFVSTKESVCTRVLLNSVTAQKYYTSKMECLNIGAFQVEDDTAKYIEDVFSALLLPWSYRIDEKILDKYFNEYRKYYTDISLDIWDKAIECAKNRFRMELEDIYMEEEKRLDNVFTSNRRVYIYGCGYRGTSLLRYIRRNQYRIEGMIISDGEPIEKYKDIGENVYFYSEICNELDESIVLIATASREVRNILEKRMLERNIYNAVDIDGKFFEAVESGR